MYFPTGLASWEIVAIAAIYAVLILAVASFIGTTAAFLLFRERVSGEQAVDAHGVLPASEAPVVAAFKTTPTVVVG